MSNINLRHNVFSSQEDLPCGLYVVSTPIGNLRDITLRALDILASVDIIACEDTRVTIKLLNHYGIKAKLLSYGDHNSKFMTDKLLDLLQQGQSIALVSDAGTPMISDPGFELIYAAKKAGVQIIPLPGCCAAITAITGSGLAMKEFHFIGFLPTKEQKLRAKLQQLVDSEALLIFYESPFRLVKTLKIMTEIFDEKRKAAICREMTKKFENYHIGDLAELYDYYSQIQHKLGEIVILVAPNLAKDIKYDDEYLQQLWHQQGQDLSLSQAAAKFARLTNMEKNHIYKILLEYKNSKKA